MLVMHTSKKILFDRIFLNYDVKKTSFTFKFSPGAVADFHSDLLLLHIHCLYLCMANCSNSSFFNTFYLRFYFNTSLFFQDSACNLF